MSEEHDREKAAIREYLGPDAGFFVEVGANHPTNYLSQTWHLEQRGWTGILVEPVQWLYELIQKERPASKAIRAACTSPDKVGQLTLKIPVVDGVARTELAGTETGVDEPEARVYETQVVPALTLDQLLEQDGGRRPDFVSIDVEGSEIDVLRGFNLERWQPKLVLIEDKWVYFTVHRHLSAHGYRLVKRTGPNSWYVPEGSGYRMLLLDRLNIWRKCYYGIWPRKLRKAREMRSWRPLQHL